MTSQSVQVHFRGRQYRISLETAHELNRRRFLKRLGSELFVEDEPYLHIVTDQDEKPSPQLRSITASVAQSVASAGQAND